MTSKTLDSFRATEPSTLASKYCTADRDGSATGEHNRSETHPPKIPTPTPWECRLYGGGIHIPNPSLLSPLSPHSCRRKNTARNDRGSHSEIPLCKNKPLYCYIVRSAHQDNAYYPIGKKSTDRWFSLVNGRERARANTERRENGNISSASPYTHPFILSFHSPTSYGVYETPVRRQHHVESVPRT